MVKLEHYHELKLPTNITHLTQDVVHKLKNKNKFICIGNRKHEVNNGTAYANASKGWNAKPLNGVISFEK